MCSFDIFVIYQSSDFAVRRFSPTGGIKNSLLQWNTVLPLIMYSLNSYV